LRSTTGIYVLATTAENDDSGTGLMTGDVIVALNETPILSVQQLRQVFGKVAGQQARRCAD
jgi:S1-C subfamily serine protease